jgi:hypothetical protein
LARKWWEDFDYVYEDEDGEGEGENNRLAWLGNGWSTAQVDSESGDIARFLHPSLMDVPAEPLPEDTPTYKLRPFSY